MDKKEILVILSSIRNVATNIENQETKLILNQNETMQLYDYLLKLKEEHERDKELINDLSLRIEKWKNN